MSSSPKNRNFREDINGLRAWAVVSVVLYHFGIPWFDGGFVGVDVFFVISGFLMVGLIVGGLENPLGKKGNFSVLNFYLARARRIIPALAGLCAALLVLGWFLLSAQEYRMLGDHVLSALGFFSNITFKQEAGYFDVASHDKLLLHTWSLSVEWQFYIILPLVLLAIWKLRPGRTPMTIMIALGLAISLCLSVVLTPLKPSLAFYLLPTRAWEMLAGGLVYMLSGRLELSGAQQKLIEAMGLGLIVAATLVFDASSSWPGWRALVPVSGAVLVLISARRGSLWTGTRPAQWLGNCSYSLYLWHWPIVVALVYLERQNDPMAIVFGLALTLVFGQLSYVLIENPSRIRLGKLSPTIGASGLMASILVVAMPSFAVRMNEGVPGRIPERINAVFREAVDRNPRHAECNFGSSMPVPGCTYGGKRLGVIVLGDSHAASIMRSVEKALPAKDLHVLDWSMGGCPTMFGVKLMGDASFRCAEFLDWALARQKELPSDVPLILINRNSNYIWGDDKSPPHYYFEKPFTQRGPEYLAEMRESLIQTACKFAQTRSVYWVRPIPEMNLNVPKVMGRALMWGGKREVSITLDQYHARNAFVWEVQDEARKKCGIKILDPLPYLCGNGHCNGSKDGIPIYYDEHHLNEHGGRLLIPMLSEVFKGNSVMPAAQAR